MTIYKTKNGIKRQIKALDELKKRIDVEKLTGYPKKGDYYHTKDNIVYRVNFININSSIANVTAVNIETSLDHVNIPLNYLTNYAKNITKLYNSKVGKILNEC